MDLAFTHHGAVDGVTGSCHQLSLPDGQAVLVEFQGAETSPDGAAPAGWRSVSRSTACAR